MFFILTLSQTIAVGDNMMWTPDSSVSARICIDVRREWKCQIKSQHDRFLSIENCVVTANIHTNMRIMLLGPVCETLVFPYNLISTQFPCMIFGNILETAFR